MSSSLLRCLSNSVMSSNDKSNPIPLLQTITDVVQLQFFRSIVRFGSRMLDETIIIILKSFRQLFVLQDIRSSSFFFFPIILPPCCNRTIFRARDSGSIRFLPTCRGFIPRVTAPPCSFPARNSSHSIPQCSSPRRLRLPVSDHVESCRAKEKGDGGGERRRDDSIVDDDDEGESRRNIYFAESPRPED